MEKVASQQRLAFATFVANKRVRKKMRNVSELKGTDGYGPFRRLNGAGKSSRKNRRVYLYMMAFIDTVPAQLYNLIED